MHIHKYMRTCLRSPWLRVEVVGLVDTVVSHLTLAKAYCFIKPILQPFLRYDILQITRASLRSALKLPVSRQAFYGSASAKTEGKGGALTVVPLAPASAFVPASLSPSLRKANTEEELEGRAGGEELFTEVRSTK
jgi:hypothetical protein